MKMFENKIKEKFKRQKENVKIKLGEIDSMIESMIKKQENMFQQTNKKLNSNNIGAVLNQDNDSVTNLDKYSDFFVEKTNKSLQIIEDDIRQLKKYLIVNNNSTSVNNPNNTNNNTFNISNKNNTESSFLKKQITNTNHYLNNTDNLKEVFDRIKGIQDVLATKLGKEDLEKSNKIIYTEIDKLVR
jgi:hypothetical protein